MVKLEGSGKKTELKFNEEALDIIRWTDRVSAENLEMSEKQAGLTFTTIFGQEKIGKSELCNKILERKPTETQFGQNVEVDFRGLKIWSVPIYNEVRGTFSFLAELEGVDPSQ
jgi:AAA+ ATPase superfamily predicted ATPase